MRNALVDLRFLWSTRRSSGFPWPFGRGLGRRDTVWRLVFGQPAWSVVPAWRQALAIPLRPWRYARMVRSIARTRAVFFNPWMYDDVP